MKTLITVLTLAASTAFAAPKTEVFNQKRLFSLYGLNCVARFGTPQNGQREQWTEIREYNGVKLYLIQESELNHKAVSAEGCNFTVLDKLQDESWHHFGHVQADIKLTKQTEASFVNGFKQCVAYYTETVEVDLGQGIILKSEEGELRKMTDCN